MLSWEAEFEFITPAFLGGEKQNPNDDQVRCELRIQSIKGALRFWYRALTGGETPEDFVKESVLWGSSEQQVGVSRVRLAVVEKGQIRIRKGSQDGELLKKIPNAPFIEEQITHKDGTRGEVRVNPLAYLGYGPVIKRMSRDYIEAGSRFVLKMILMPREKESDVDEITSAVLKSLWLFSTFGGLGSRSRRGYGSLRIINSPYVFARQSWHQSNSIGKTLRNITAERGDAFDHPAPLLNQRAGLWVSKQIYPHWQECLWFLGREYHNWRQALPVNAGRENLGWPILHGHSDINNKKRRASPYHLRVWREADAFRYAVLFLPSAFPKALFRISSDEQETAHRRFQERILTTCTREV